MSPSERFWSKVQVTGFCWLWTAGGDKGYGRFSVGNGVRMLAHRYAYESLVGPIPEGMTLDHLCRIPACVNPDHLEPVTMSENSKRIIRRPPWKGSDRERAYKAAWVRTRREREKHEGVVAGSR